MNPRDAAGGLHRAGGRPAGLCVFTRERPVPAAEEAARLGAVTTAGPFGFPGSVLLAEIYGKRCRRTPSRYGSRRI